MSPGTAPAGDAAGPEPDPSHSTRRPIEVAAALLFRDGSLLITQRPHGSHLAGLWEFPGGKREPGEGWKECLRRELLEELGVGTEVGPLFEEIVHPYPNKSVHLRFYLAKLTSGEPRPLGCAAVAWVDPAGLDQYEFPSADATIVERLRTTPSLWSATSWNPAGDDLI
jgi:8-oxo-dGTP diphosphatase